VGLAGLLVGGGLLVGSPVGGGVGAGQFSLGDLAAEHESDDPRVMFLTLDLGEGNRSDGLFEFEDTAGWFREVVVAALDERSAAVIVAMTARRRRRVAWGVAGGHLCASVTGADMCTS
jgi:hypothetical protein